MTKWILIGRHHVDDRYGFNNWKSLSNYVKREIKPIEETKALILVKNKDSLEQTKNKLNIYNRLNWTDFFIDDIGCDFK